MLLLELTGRLSPLTEGDMKPRFGAASGAAADCIGSAGWLRRGRGHKAVTTHGDDDLTTTSRQAQGVLSRGHDRNLESPRDSSGFAYLQIEIGPTPQIEWADATRAVNPFTVSSMNFYAPI